MKWTAFPVIGVIVAVIVAWSSLFIVDEREKALAAEKLAAGTKLVIEDLVAGRSFVLDEELEFEDYQHNLTRMFGAEVMESVIGSINGDLAFCGLTPTSMKLEGLERHQKLIESYKKLHQARALKAAQ